MSSRWTVPGYVPVRDLGDRTVVATHTATGTGVAIRYGAPDRDRVRFFASLDAPHLTHVFDYVETADGDAATVREFVDGASLAELGPLPPGAAAVVLRDVLTALAGIEHGGVKPANILVDRAGLVRLADFAPTSLVPTSPAPAPAGSGAADTAAAAALLGPMLTGRKLRDAPVGTLAELDAVARKAFGADWVTEGRGRLVKSVAKAGKR